MSTSHDWDEVLREQKRMNELLEDIAEGLEVSVNLLWGINQLKQCPTIWTRPSKRTEPEGE